MHLACGYKIHLALGNEGIQIRLMLEEVGIQLLIVQSQVRFNIIAEFDNLQVYALFSQSAFDLVQDFSMRYSGSTDLQGNLFVGTVVCLFVSAATACSNNCQAY